MHELNYQLPAIPSALLAAWRATVGACAGSGFTEAAQTPVDFYFDQLLPAIAAQLDARNAVDPRAERLDGLASLVGMSPQTTVLAAELLRPRSLLLVSSGAGDSLERICAWFARRPAPLRPQFVCAAQCAPTDSAAIIRAIRAWRAELGPNATSAIDATGGRKSMSAAAGMLAATDGIGLAYLESDYCAALRSAVPGSEQLVWLAHRPRLGAA